MAVSQNGWPIVGESQVTDAPILGHRFPNGFLKGDVFLAFTWLFTQLHNRVESIDDGLPLDEWGWFVKNIEGSTTKSNHGSGTAGDYNARLHVMGVRNTYNASQRAEIHKILDEADGIFRWGGDYTGRPDDMHFEIIKSRQAVHAFVQKITPKEDDMPFTLKEIAEAVVAELSGTTLGSSGPNWAQDVERSEAIQATVEAIKVDVNAIKASVANLENQADVPGE